MTTQPDPPEDLPLVKALVNLSRDRGQMAQLRRYWSATTRYDSWPVLGRLGTLDSPSDQLAAALFGEHCRQELLHRSGGSRVGRAALVVAGGSVKAESFPAFERHFRRLLACDDLVELSAPLHRLFKRLQRASVVLDYNQLVWNLRNWSKDPERVKTEWARGFWQAPELTAVEASE